MATRRWKLLGPGSGRVIIVVIALAGLWWVSIQGWWGQALSPFTRLTTWIQDQSLGASHQTTGTERQALLQQAAKLTAQLSAAEAQVRLSHDLDLLAQYASSNHRRILTAQVIAHQTDPGIDSLTIGQGSHQGIHSGQAVIDSNGLLIGKIVTVRNSSATVLLVTDHQSVVIAEVTNAARSQGVVRGERGLSLRLDYLPKTDVITTGQAVVTSGTETGIPAGLPIGSISQVSTRSGDVFQSASVLSPIQPQEQSVVAVVVS